MSYIICHNEGHYNFYSTVSDSFVYESSLTLKQLKSVYHKYGSDRYNKLSDRLERANKTGSSSLIDFCLEEMLSCNRAGPSESELSYDECIERFLS